MREIDELVNVNVCGRFESSSDEDPTVFRKCTVFQMLVRVVLGVVCTCVRVVNRQDFLQNLNSSFHYVDTSADIIKMGESSTNILNLSESALNSLKKSDLMQNILGLKGKVLVDTDLHKLSDQICKLTEVIDQISLENKKLTSELSITKNVNSRLE